MLLSRTFYLLKDFARGEKTTKSVKPQIRENAEKSAEKKIENGIEIKTRKSTSRDELLSAAMELFWEKGYTATGINDVLARSKVSAGSMYHHFKSKEKLLMGVLDRLSEIM